MNKFITKLKKGSPEVTVWKLAEECGEVIQAISKIHRFGYKGKRRGIYHNNIKDLKGELGDLRIALDKVEELLDE